MKKRVLRVSIPGIVLRSHRRLQEVLVNRAEQEPDAELDPQKIAPRANQSQRRPRWRGAVFDRERRVRKSIHRRRVGDLRGGRDEDRRISRGVVEACAHDAGCLPTSRSLGSLQPKRDASLGVVTRATTSSVETPRCASSPEAAFDIVCPHGCGTCFRHSSKPVQHSNDDSLLWCEACNKQFRVGGGICKVCRVEVVECYHSGTRPCSLARGNGEFGECIDTNIVHKPLTAVIDSVGRPSGRPSQPQLFDDEEFVPRPRWRSTVLRLRRRSSIARRSILRLPACKPASAKPCSIGSRKSSLWTHSTSGVKRVRALDIGIGDWKPKEPATPLADWSDSEPANSFVSDDIPG